MKKIAVLLVFLLGLMFSGVAEDMKFDLASMSLEDLLKLQLEVQEEIYNRDPYDEIVLYPGTYCVDEQIEPGTYIFKCLELVNGESVAHVECYARSSKDEQPGSGKSRGSQWNMEPGDVWQNTLEDLDYFRIDSIFTMIKRK